MTSAADEASLAAHRVRTARSLSQRWRSLFAIDPREATLARRGFTANSAVGRQLERIGETFIHGFNHGLLAENTDDLRPIVESIGLDTRGFAVEGASMGVAVADALTFGTGRLRAWMAASEAQYTYLAHVGIGWALARAPWRRRLMLQGRDPVHGWLVFDGLGFHDAFFATARIVGGWRRVRRGYAANVYDQGVGRAIWFIAGGSVARAIDVVRRFHSTRHSDLWSGLGLALAYAGGADRVDLRLAVRVAGSAGPWLAQGAAFAAEARSRANHVPPDTHEAVKILSGLDTEDAVRLVRQVRASLPSAENGETPRYELWRRGVRQALGATGDARHA